MSGVYKSDCMPFMAAMPDNCIDLCLTDPPYGVNFKSKTKRNPEFAKNRAGGLGNYFPKIANDKRPFTEWIAPLYRVMKPGGRVLCFYRWDVQTEFIDAFRAAGFRVKSQIIWDKMAHGSGDLKGGFAPQHESILYAVKGKYDFPGKRPRSVYRYMKVNSQNLTHPNEKPQALLHQLIKDVSTPGEVTFDPFGGSFSTYEASEALGRPCITTELTDEYYDRGTYRLRQKGVQYQFC